MSGKGCTHMAHALVQTGDATPSVAAATIASAAAAMAVTARRRR